MAKTPKRLRDPNQLAKLIVELATEEQVPPRQHRLTESSGVVQAG